MLEINQLKVAIQDEKQKTKEILCGLNLKIKAQKSNMRRPLQKLVKINYFIAVNAD